MILRWTLTLGIVGFLSGFIGPIILAPEANQGPLLGIIITGPGGLVLGFLTGTIMAFAGFSDRTSRSALTFAASALALITLVFCIPTPRRVADLVHAKVLACADAASFKDEAVAREYDIDAEHHYRHNKPWDAEFARMLREKPGVVIDVSAQRVRTIFEGRSHWSYGKLTAGPWTMVTTAARYFAAGFDCGNLPAGQTMTFALVGGGKSWPPYDIGELLKLPTATAMPAEFAQFASL